MSVIHRKDEPEQPKKFDQPEKGKTTEELDKADEEKRLKDLDEARNNEPGPLEPEPVYYAPIPEQKHADYAERELVEPPEQDNPNLEQSDKLKTVDPEPGRPKQDKA